MNSDYEEKVFIDTDRLIWQEHTANSQIKCLSQKEKEQTALLKIDGPLCQVDKINSVEIFVLKGSYTNEFGSFEQGCYLKLPFENEKYVSSQQGCIIFRKINYAHNDEKIIIDTQKEPWHQGQGNLTVMPLSVQAALVKWPKDEVFIPHKHWGGEEIFVLSGVFMDEHGEYKENSWLRSPHLSEHFPYVKEETIIFVKTGHL